jgi:hypothetical protein
VGAHRAAAGCSGKRDRAAFVPLLAFDDKTLLSDLRLLEETARAAERAKRSRGGGEDDARGGGGGELPRNALQLQRVRRRETLLRVRRPGGLCVARALTWHGGRTGGARARHGAALPGGGHGAAGGQHQRRAAEDKGTPRHAPPRRLCGRRRRVLCLRVRADALKRIRTPPARAR